MSQGLDWRTLWEEVEEADLQPEEKATVGSICSRLLPT